MIFEWQLNGAAAQPAGVLFVCKPQSQRLCNSLYSSKPHLFSQNFTFQKCVICAPHSPVCLIFYPPFNRRGGAPTRRFAFPAGQEEANTLHQSPAERAGERVRREQVHHQRQEEEDLRRHQPVGAADHHLVPEQEGEGEEVRGQSEEQRAVAPAGTVSGITWCMCILLMKNKLGKKAKGKN